jgi:hypothetical protein
MIWLWLLLAGIGVGVGAWFLSTFFHSILGIIIAILFFVGVNVLFIYAWYYIIKWGYYIVVNAKLFVQKSVNWVLAIFE